MVHTVTEVPKGNRRFDYRHTVGTIHTACDVSTAHYVCVCDVTQDCDIGNIHTSSDVKNFTLIGHILQSTISFLCRNSFIKVHSVQSTMMGSSQHVGGL